MMETANSQSLQTIWQSVLAEIKTEIPRSAFDTWVLYSQPVSFTNDTFTIGCYNRYGMNWLEQNLTPIFQRILSRILGHAVDLRFTVIDMNSNPIPEVIETDAISQTEEDTADPKAINLQIHYHSIRDMLVEPERVVRLPVYYLRWLPYVGSQTLFLVLALWQEAYLKSAKKNTRGNVSIAVRAESICQWAGVSRAGFFRLLKHENLGWFLQKSETDHELDRQTGKVKKSSNRYTLYSTPLTPGDAIDLKRFLLANHIVDSPKAALQTALAAAPNQILQYPIRLPPVEFTAMTPHPISVQMVVRELAGHHLDAALSDLADQLSAHLLEQGEFLLISWYFLENWLPLLGHNAAMFVILLRNLCYCNDETGEIRDEVWFPGGYESIAQRLGIQNPRMVATWLPAALKRKKSPVEHTTRTIQEQDRRKHIQFLLGSFIQRVDQRTESGGRYAWKFKVQRGEPLIPTHEVVHKTALKLLQSTSEQGLFDEFSHWLSINENDCFEIVKTGTRIELRLSSLGKNCSDTLKTILKDCCETLELGGEDCIETLLKILKSFKDSNKGVDPSCKPEQAIHNATSPSFHSKAVSASSVLNLETLLGRVGRKNRLFLVQHEKNVIPFLSWILYGAAKNTIQSPYSLAIARLKQNPGSIPNEISERLASTPPDQLVAMIQQALSDQPVQNTDWNFLFGNVSKSRIHLLAGELGLCRNNANHPA